MVGPHGVVQAARDVPEKDWKIRLGLGQGAGMTALMEALAAFSRLRELDLRGNRLTTVPAELGQLGSPRARQPDAARSQPQAADGGARRSSSGSSAA